MTDFQYPHQRIRMMKANDVERDRKIRIYKSGPEDWEIQLRAPIGLGTFGLRDGKDFIIAGASCSLDDLRAIREALDEQIKDAEFSQRNPPGPSVETLKDRGAWP